MFLKDLIMGGKAVYRFYPPILLEIRGA